MYLPKLTARFADQLGTFIYNLEKKPLQSKPMLFQAVEFLKEYQAERQPRRRKSDLPSNRFRDYLEREDHRITKYWTRDWSGTKKFDPSAKPVIANRYFSSFVLQTFLVMLWNIDNDWGYTPDDFLNLVQPPEWDNYVGELQAITLVPYLPYGKARVLQKADPDHPVYRYFPIDREDDFNDVSAPIRSTLELWRLAQKTYPSYGESLFGIDAFGQLHPEERLQLAPKIPYPFVIVDQTKPALRWEVIDFGRCLPGKRLPQLDPTRFAHVGLFAALALHPNLTEIYDRSSTLGILAFAYQYNAEHRLGDPDFEYTPHIYYLNKEAAGDPKAERLEISWSQTQLLYDSVLIWTVPTLCPLPPPTEPSSVFCWEDELTKMPI